MRRLFLRRPRPFAPWPGARLLSKRAVLYWAKNSAEKSRAGPGRRRTLQEGGAPRGKVFQAKKPGACRPFAARPAAHCARPGARASLFRPGRRAFAGHGRSPVPQAQPLCHFLFGHHAVCGRGHFVLRRVLGAARCAPTTASGGRPACCWARSSSFRGCGCSPTPACWIFLWPPPIAAHRSPSFLSQLYAAAPPLPFLPQGHGVFRLGPAGIRRAFDAEFCLFCSADAAARSQGRLLLFAAGPPRAHFCADARCWAFATRGTSFAPKAGSGSAWPAACCCLWPALRRRWFAFCSFRGRSTPRCTAWASFF